jgi:hypothetical protein
MTSIDQPKPAENYDGIRYAVPSESTPHETYVVDLDAYNGAGRCSCQHFICRLEPLVAKFYTPERAVQEGLIKLKPGQKIETALRCKHLQSAREKFASDVLAAIAEKKRHDRTP